MSAGYYFACGVRADNGGAECWGEPIGALGSAPEGEFVRIAASNDDVATACAVDEAGALVCWGDENSMVLDYGPSTGTFRDVELGAQTGLAVDTDDRLHCWGGGECPSEDGTSVVDIQVGQDGACVLHEDGRVECSARSPNPSEEVPSGVFVSIGVGTGFTCAVDENFDIWCWGSNNDGPGYEPYQLEPPPGEFQIVSAYGNTICGVKRSGELVCWGLTEPFSGLEELAHIWKG